MNTTNLDVIQLLHDLKRISVRVLTALGGSSLSSDAFVMTYLALSYNLKNSADIGVNASGNFLSMAHAAKLLNGMVYGIDTSGSRTAGDAQQTHDDLERLRQELGLADHSQMIQAVSAAAIDSFRENQIAIDMLHVGGHHIGELERCLSLLSEGGFVVLNDVDWDSVKPVYRQLQEDYEVVFDNGRFAILSSEKLPLLQKHRLNILHSLAENAARPRKSGESKISVVVTTYNHEKYIAECLDGIFAQRGDFIVEVVIGDDFSTDRTPEIIRDYATAFGDNRFNVNILVADHNLGMTKNLQRALAVCTGNYIAICEGDDYWTNPEKLHKQVEFLKSHPGCDLCFHDFYMYFQEEGEAALFDLQQELQADVITTRELILNNYIGNFSCCMYNAHVMKKLPSGLFDLPMADWMFNIYVSQFGEIGHLKETLSVYRKHREGLWTGRELETREVQLHGFIEQYNKFLNYDFDPEFSSVQKRIVNTSPAKFKKQALDIAIIDDAFPHPLSAFRLQELTCYLKEFENLKIFSTGEALPWLGSETLDNLFRDFKRAFPEFAPRIERLTPGTVIHTSSLYFIFLGTAYKHVELAEQLGVPFVFTLYPGSVFGIHNEKSDAMLKRLTSSPCFRKVIVTQKITYDYLIKKGFCRPEQIEFFFGVVTPLEQMEADYTKEKRFGAEKNRLDICFVAHKYAPTGIDKGYDVFVDVARRLCKTYDDIHFHVVGGFDTDVIDVTDLKDRITFYGRRDMEWFDEFYKDKDIILSPNMPFMNPQVPGSFDGFPTATCVDAGLRKTAIFCTDDLGLNTKFVDWEEIVIIPHDAGPVTSILEYYYQHPEEIRNIAEKGSRRIKQLYSYEAQILPRINLLRQEIQRAGQSREEIRRTLNARRKKSKMSEATFGLLTGLKKRIPPWVMNLLRRGMHTLRSRKRLLALLKRVLPAPLLRFLAKLRDSA